MWLSNMALLREVVVHTQVVASIMMQTGVMQISDGRDKLRTAGTSGRPHVDVMDVVCVGLAWSALQSLCPCCCSLLKIRSKGRIKYDDGNEL